jgi:hypothetical protein
MKARQARRRTGSRLAIFFDTFQNAWDDPGNHIAICSNGSVYDLRWPPRCLSYSLELRANLKDGNPHRVRITYVPPRLSVYLDDFPCITNTRHQEMRDFRAPPYAREATNTTPPNMSVSEK